MIRIHYQRLPDRFEIFEQQLVARRSDVIVTYLAATSLRKPVIAREQVVLEDGAPVVWFTFPGAWHDIGRFHLCDGTFTGYYANVLTPVEISDDEWRTTDLFLDVWLATNGSSALLDEDEFTSAIAEGHLSPQLALRARGEAEDILERAGAGVWPPAVVNEFTLERARTIVEEGTRDDDRV